MIGSIGDFMKTVVKHSLNISANYACTNKLVEWYTPFMKAVVKHLPVYVLMD